MVPNATVAILVSGGQTHSATTNRSGGYEIGNLAPGKYTVTANAQGFAVFVQNDVDVAAGQVAQFNIALDINVQKEKVNVQEEDSASRRQPRQQCQRDRAQRQRSGSASRRSR